MGTGETVDVAELIESRPFGSFQIGIVALCALIALFDGYDLQVIGLGAPAIAQLLKIPQAAMGGVFSAALAGLALGAFGLGPVADRIGRKSVLIACTICFGLFTLATPLAGSFDQLLVIRFLAGLGLGGAVPSFIALVSEYTPRRIRATVIALLWAGFPFGGVLGGLLGSWLIPTLGWQWLFWIGGAMPIVATLFLVAFLPESLRYMVESGASSDRIHALLSRVFETSVAADARFSLGEEHSVRGSVGQLFTHGRALGTVLLWISFFIVYLQLVTNSAWSPTLLAHAGVPVARTALAMAAFNFGSVIGTSFAGKLLIRLGTRTVLPIALIGALLSYGVVGYVARNVGLVIALESLIGLFLGCASASLIAVSALLYPTSIRSTGIGWALGMGRFGSFVGPLVVRALLNDGWAVGPIFLAIAAPACIAAFTAGAIPKIRST